MKTTLLSLLCSLARRKGLTKAESRFLNGIDGDCDLLWPLNQHITVVQLDFDTFRIETPNTFRDVKIRGNRVLRDRLAMKGVRVDYYTT
jgi:hypothetical protein